MGSAYAYQRYVLSWQLAAAKSFNDMPFYPFALFAYFILQYVNMLLEKV